MSCSPLWKLHLKSFISDGEVHRKELKTVYESSDRIICAKNGDFNAMKKIRSAVCYAWFCWEKGYHGDPVIKWIN